MSDERIKKAYDLAEKYGTAEREFRWHESGLDADDCFRDLMIYVKGLVARIAELKPIIDKLVEGIDSLTSGFPLEIEYIEAVEIAKDWKTG